jgi:ATP-dependent Clp protease protease subunit
LNTIVTEINEQGEEIALDVFQKLSNDRILFIVGDINDDIASDVIATLLLRDSENSEQKITIFINSQGGDIRSTFAIYDAMCLVESPIETFCIGTAMQNAVILLTAGTPGMRLATKHSVICIEQLVNDYMRHSDLTEAKTSLALSLDDNKRMMNIFAKSTNKPIKQIMSDFDRKVFMSTQQALKYGFIDKIAPFNKL